MVVPIALRDNIGQYENNRQKIVYTCLLFSSKLIKMMNYAKVDYLICGDMYAYRRNHPYSAMPGKRRPYQIGCQASARTGR
jgi:hypothetical protein